jgi:hypothetical protein
MAAWVQALIAAIAMAVSALVGIYGASLADKFDFFSRNIEYSILISDTFDGSKGRFSIASVEIENSHRGMAEDFSATIKIKNAIIDDIKSNSPKNVIVKKITNQR